MSAFVRHVKKSGVRGAIRLSARNVVVGAATAKDVYYDWWNGVSTREVVALNSLDIYSENKKEGEDYILTPRSVVDRTIRSICGSLDNLVFVDVGSGKGRVILHAAKFPFRRVIGVEFSEELHKTCKENINRFRKKGVRCGSIESVCADAAYWELPENDMLIFMFNPFSEKVMRTFVKRLVKHHAAHGCKIYLAYYNPKYGSVIRETGTFKDKAVLQPILYCSAFPIWPLAMFESKDFADPPGQGDPNEQRG